MDTSNNLDFTVNDLLKGTPEEVELAQKASSVMDEIIRSLKPILSYISKPLPVLTDVQERIAKCATHAFRDVEGCKDRGIKLLTLEDKKYRVVFWENSYGQGSTSGSMGEFLFLGDDGAFFLAYSCPYERDGVQSHYHYKNKDPEVWKKVSFQAVISALQVALADAKKKREQHLMAIEERSEKLDQILQILTA